MRARSGFTLFELLVVIAIIAWTGMCPGAPLLKWSFAGLGRPLEIPAFGGKDAGAFTHHGAGRKEIQRNVVCE